MNASIPQGEYYIAFGGGSCANMYVNLSTGLLSGCGKVELVPCSEGSDCKDCGRSASPQRRQLRSLHSQKMALPALDDAQEMPHLQRIMQTATSYKLPQPYASAIPLGNH